ncbi:unnamed protein product [Notodromas monacha]|uniref:Ethylmalonyl-CoA decarboxylase n=1 Tax=Notodromas monacha TaxID=399045 RepID=A0A7R9BLB9_9CRUS|nr:unnamed protein product [Notodromas monacha]CAG0916115.1 unnamed protein product [Notodromas monacha]
MQGRDLLGMCALRSRSLSVDAASILKTKEDLRSKYPVGSVDLELDSKSEIAVIRLCHPARRNALSGKMMAELNDRITELKNWKGRGLVLCGGISPSPASFCSGGDLKTMSGIMSEGPSAGMAMCALMQDSMVKLRALPLVSVAVIHGTAIGGGAELTTWCDYRVFTTEGSVSFVQIKMGLTTGWGGGSGLMEILGRRKTLKLLLAGPKISLRCDDAESWGYSDATVSVSPGDDPAEKGKEFLLNSVLNSELDSGVGRAVKKMVASVAVEPCISNSLDKEREVFGEVWGGPVQQAAFAQFLKR